MYQKPYTRTEINLLLHFSDMKALILRFKQCTRAHISRDPKAFQPQRAESKLTYVALLSLSNSLYLYEFNRYLGL